MECIEYPIHSVYIIQSIALMYAIAHCSNKIGMAMVLVGLQNKTVVISHVMIFIIYMHSHNLI